MDHANFIVAIWMEESLVLDEMYIMKTTTNYHMAKFALFCYN